MAGLAPAGLGFPSIEEIRANPIVARGKEKAVLTDLAFDLSSSAVGWAVGANRKLQRYGKLVFKTTAGPGEKLVYFEEYLDTLIQTYWPKALIVERPLSKKANTTARHFELLGIVRKVWAEHTGGELLDNWIISPTTIKSLMQVQRGADHTQNKIIMVNKINQLYGLSLKFDKNSKYKTDDDTADAIAALTTFWRRNSRE